MGRPALPEIERFMAKVEVSDSGCWEWRANLGRYGYAVFRGGPDHQFRMLRAARFSYEHFVGEIPDGLQIDHLCRNRACVNPAHLEAVTPRENTLRATRLRTHCVNGHSEPLIHVPHTKQRICRACQRERQRRYLERKAAQ